MLTKNFSVRGQVNLIDYLATLDGLFKCLLNYQDHAIKLADTKIANALLNIFTMIGPSDILQSNNAGEFSNIARNSKTMCFSEDELNTIISCVHQLWPGAKKVIGTSCHS